MAVIFLLLKIILLLLLVIFLIAVIFHFLGIVFKEQAPYIISLPKVIRQAVAELDLPPQFLAYELGCGDAPFLRQLVKKYPQVRGIGVEHSLWPYAIAKIFTLFKPQIKIVKKSIYTVDLSSADLIYCYLNLASMVQLEKNFLAEGKDSLEVISYNFPLPSMEPYKVLRISKMPLYFYRLNRHRK